MEWKIKENRKYKEKGQKARYKEQESDKGKMEVERRKRKKQGKYMKEGQISTDRKKQGRKEGCKDK